MDWGKGFFRLWVACSIVWAGLITLFSPSLFQAVRQRGFSVHHATESEATTVALITIIAVMVLPPLAFYIFGRIIGWIAKGFTRE
jgi:hypothetical protein